MIRLARGRSLLLAVALTGTGLGVASAPPVAAANGCGHRHGAWTVVNAPAFPTSAASHAQATTADLVPGGTASRLFATNGDTIMRSTNLGCSWSAVFSLDPTRNPSAAGWPDTLLRTWPEAVITSVAAASSTVDYAVIRGQGTTSNGLAGVTGAPLFWAASTNGGTSWQLSVVEAPWAAGSPPIPVLAGSATPSLYLAPSDPRTAYVSMNNNSADPTTAQTGLDEAASEASTPLPYRTPDVIGTTNGGTSWYALGQSLNTHSGGQFIVDPSNSRTLWAYGSPDWGSQDGVLSESTDGGRTWYSAPRATHTIGTRRAEVEGVQWLDVAHPRGSAARLLMNWPDGSAYSGNTPPPTLYASNNAGHSWKILGTPPTLNAWSYVLTVRPRWLCTQGQDALVLAELQGGSFYYSPATGGPDTPPTQPANYRFLRLHRGAWAAVTPPSFPVPSNATVSYSDFQSSGTDHQHLFLTAYVTEQQTSAADQTTTTVTPYGLLYDGGC